jgi:hypothetical protein
MRVRSRLPGARLHSPSDPVPLACPFVESGDRARFEQRAPWCSRRASSASIRIVRGSALRAVSTSGTTPGQRLCGTDDVTSGFERKCLQELAPVPVHSAPVADSRARLESERLRVAGFAWRLLGAPYAFVRDAARCQGSARNRKLSRAWRAMQAGGGARSRRRTRGTNGPSPRLLTVPAARRTTRRTRLIEHVRHELRQ